MSTFKNFDSSDVVNGRIQSVSEGMFPGGSPTQAQSQLYTSSMQVRTQGNSEFDIKSGLYYWDVYSSDPDSENTEETSEVIFSLSYGHYAGTGSSAADKSRLFINPTKAIYTQYKNLILTPDDDKFTFQSGSGASADLVDVDEIYVLNFAASKFKERLDAGLFQFSLTGSAGEFTFVDDSIADSVSGQITKRSSYNIVQGSLETASSGSVVQSPQGLGMFYPSLGVVVLSAKNIDAVINNGSGEFLGDDGDADYALNQRKLYNAIVNCESNMHLRSTELVPSRQYFIRVKNQEFNYSNNPTFVKTYDSNATSTDEGKIRFPDFYNDPKVYITTVGLYNDENELVAVAKLSQPFQKSFDNEALIKVKLNV